MDINKSRKFKAANVIQIALIDILRNKAKTLDIRFSKLDVTITKVDVTGDLKIAKCFFVPTYGLNKMPLEEISQTLHANVRSIRLLLTSKVKLKYSPEIQFFYDKSLKEMYNIDRLLNNIS